MKKTLWLYPIFFTITALFCLIFLILTASIPQRMIEEHTAQSATYFQETPLFEYCVDELENFRRDNYADCISTSIAYHFGEGNAYEAVISAEFNHVNGENVNTSFYRQLQGEKVETDSYSRYWHGSAGIIRLLLTVMNIRTMRYLLTVIGVILNASLVILLLRRKQKALGVIYTLAFLLTNGVFALGCLEYGFVFLLIPLAGLILITGKNRRKNIKAHLTFLVTGILTAYFDFLTTETLTFTIPFVIYYIAVYRGEADAEKRDKPKESIQSIRIFLKNGLSWFVGYMGMFWLKWILAVLLLGKDAWITTFGSLKERIGGDVSGTATFSERIQGIFIRNLGCLYWGSNEMKVTTVFLITLIIIILLAVFWYMARKEKIKNNGLAVLAVVGILPYIRFLVLSNHSYIHYFFTYRAQMVTIMVILLIIYETTVLSEGIKRRK